MKKLLIIALIAFSFASCKKDLETENSNRFEVSFVASDLNQTASFTVYATSNGQTFRPIKEVTPQPGKDVTYKVQFEIPDAVSDDGLQFYIEETMKDGKKVKSQIVTVE